MKKIIKIGLVSLIGVITAANGTFLGITYNKYRKTGGVVYTSLPSAVVKQQVAIVSSKSKRINESQLGTPFETGKYDFEERDHSKYANDTPDAQGQLALATNEATKAHFVLALGASAAIDQSTINEGWKFDTVSIDQMWQPGGCGSKPTQLLSGRYIFVDDGKTNATDKYGSYIFFDIQTGKYRYFGGDHFTQTQGDTERIIKVDNENDKVVFYVDVQDDGAAPSDQGASTHNVTKDHGYIIRRVLDTETLGYTDYKLAIDIPYGIANYTIFAGYGSNAFSLNGYNLSSTGEFKGYSGAVSENRVVFTPTPDSVAYGTAADSDLELHINDQLKKLLPDFLSDPKNAASTESSYKTSFSASVIGSYRDSSYLILSSRIAYAQVPAVYDAASGTIHVLTNKPLLDYTNYVPLGVY